MQHLGWFADLTTRRRRTVWGSQLLLWFERLRIELHNLRAALEWSVAASSHGEQVPSAVENGLRLGGALWHFWDLQGYASEGRIRLCSSSARQRAVRRREPRRSTPRISQLHRRQPNREAADWRGRRWPTRASSCPHSCTPPRPSACRSARWPRAMAHAPLRYRQALDWSRQAGERRGMYYALYGLVEVERMRGDFDRAVSLMEDAHALTVEQRDPWSIAFALSILSNLTLARGELGRAETLQRESLALRHSMGEPGRCQDEASTRWGGSPRQAIGRRAPRGCLVPPTHSVKRSAWPLMHRGARSTRHTSQLHGSSSATRRLASPGPKAARCRGMTRSPTRCNPRRSLCALLCASPNNPPGATPRWRSRAEPTRARGCRALGSLVG